MKLPKISILTSLIFVVCVGLGAILVLNSYSQSKAEDVKKAIGGLMEKMTALGVPTLDGATLTFGKEEINGNYDVVDEIAEKFTCTATIFAKKGDGFVRISTNVIKDGNRAVGTQLDPNGPAIAKIKVGEAYYGEADILGTKYETGYEPIKNAAGEIIGVYYVGYKK